ncbi:MAG: hypothetical protein COB36_12745 [Alphaproteobacteria bacterium]|nr:MAG: hypothetical protein COB36_12745 [Alphaproteobacteria bacterium]
MNKNTNISLWLYSMKYTFAGFALSSILSAPSFAQDVTVDLNPGRWVYSQSTLINGDATPMFDLSGSHCLTLKEANQKVSYYIDKFYTGLGGGSDCTIENLNKQSGEITATVQCQSGTMLEIEYKYSKTHVDIKAVGWMKLHGRKMRIVVDATSSREGECRHAQTKIKNPPIQPTSAKHLPVSKASTHQYKITPTMAGHASQPATGPLMFLLNHISNAFPYAVIKTGRAETYGTEQDVFNIYDRNYPKPIFQIDRRRDTDIAFSIFTRHPIVEGPFGERIGHTRLGDVDPDNPHLCSQGLNEMSNKIICLTGETFRSIYGFSDTASAQSSPIISQYAANKTVLEEMRYYTGYPKNWGEAPSILKLKPNTLRSQLKKLGSKKPVIVHFTSNDGSCSHCEKSNKEFRIISQQEIKEFAFGEVVFNPWRKYLKKYKSLGGLPTTQIYMDTIPIVKITGNHDDLEVKILQAYAKAKKILSADYSNAPVEKVTSIALDGLINRNRGNKFLLVHVTSSSKACPFCVKNNAFFRAASEEYGDKFDFAELSLPSVSALRTDADLLIFLQSQNISISGLPDMLFIKNGEIKSKRPGIWSTILDDLNKIRP